MPRAKVLPGQLGLFDAPPEEPEKTSAPKPVKRTARKPYPDLEDPHKFLEMLCKEDECLIFLYGKNPHICAVRSHSSRDDEKPRWVDRRRAEKILADSRYARFCRHSRGELRAVVYRRP